MSSEASKAPRALVCEDHKDSADLFATTLRSAGYEVLVCLDGHSAIAQVEAWSPAVAVIDIGLPGVTGYGVAQHIRELPIGTKVLLIAITGYDAPADIEMARYAGFNWHIAKPARPSVLLDILRNPRRIPSDKGSGIPLNPPR